jgi:RNA polymerase sigma factor (sigma-70 family)
MMAVNEEVLLRAFQHSPSREALRGLLLAHQHRIYNACFQVLVRTEDAEDAAQEVLLKLAEGARVARDADSFRGWIYRVSLRAAIDLWRRREATQARESRAAMNRPLSPPLDDRERIALFEAMDSLDDTERSLLLEHYFEKVPLTALADRRGVSAVAIWKRIDRAREKLKKLLLAAGFAAVSSRMADALEASVPAMAPTSLLAEAALSRILGEGVALGISKVSTTSAVVMSVALLLVLSTSTYLLLSDEPRQASGAKPARGVVTHDAAPLPSRATSITATPSSPVAPPVPRKSKLRELLEKYKAKHSNRAGATFSMDAPEEPNLLGGARALIIQDPQTFLEFIRDPGHDALCGDLIGTALDHGREIDGAKQKIEEFPKELVDGFLEALKSGGPGLKSALLGFLVQMESVPESYDLQYASLLYDSDTRVQTQAIRALTRWSSLPAQTLELMRQRYESSPDPEVRSAALEAIGRTDTAEVQRWMIARIEFDRDPNMARYVAKASLNSLMSKAGNADHETLARHAWALKTVSKVKTSRHTYYAIVLATLQMPPAWSLPVLEAALPNAPTPKLAESVTKMMDRIREGANWKELSLQFQQLSPLK